MGKQFYDGPVTFKSRIVRLRTRASWASQLTELMMKGQRLEGVVVAPDKLYVPVAILPTSLLGVMRESNKIRRCAFESIPGFDVEKGWYQTFTREMVEEIDG